MQVWRNIFCKDPSNVNWGQKSFWEFRSLGEIGYSYSLISHTEKKLFHNINLFSVERVLSTSQFLDGLATEVRVINMNCNDNGNNVMRQCKNLSKEDGLHSSSTDRDFGSVEEVKPINFNHCSILCHNS